MNEYYKVVTPLFLSIKTSAEGLIEGDRNPFVLFYDTIKATICVPGSLGICVKKTIKESIEFQKQLLQRSMVIKVYSDSEEKIPPEISKHPAMLKELIYFYMNNDPNSRTKNSDIWLESVYYKGDTPCSFLERYGKDTWELK